MVKNEIFSELFQTFLRLHFINVDWLLPKYYVNIFSSFDSADDPTTFCIILTFIAWKALAIFTNWCCGVLTAAAGCATFALSDDARGHNYTSVRMFSFFTPLITFAWNIAMI